MERRHERCALAPGSDVAAAEIGDHVDAGQLGEERRRVQLHRVAGSSRAGPVAHGLAVCPDRDHLGAIDRRAAQDSVDDRGCLVGKLVCSERCAMDLVRTALVQGGELGAQTGREAAPCVPQHAQGRRAARAS